MNKKSVLILSYLDNKIIKELKKKYKIYFKIPNSKHLQKQIEILIVDVRPIGLSLYQKLKNLKLVARYGVGYDNIDLKYLKTHNIKLALTRKSVVNPVAEHALSLMLYALRKIQKFDELIKKNQYENTLKYPDTYNLEGKKIFLIGLGAIGGKLLKLLEPFNCKILYYDPFLKKKIINKYIKPVTLKMGLKIANIVSIHIPLNDKTKKIVNSNFLKNMKSDAIFINTSRGKIVNESDLIKKLKQNPKFTACLDVFYDEPLKKNYPLIKLNNTILSPHISTSTLDTKLKMSEEVFDNIIKFNNKKTKFKNFLKL
jgi:phosphoglycerate dehydrogenase-like enzyme